MGMNFNPDKQNTADKAKLRRYFSPRKISIFTTFYLKIMTRSLNPCDLMPGRNFDGETKLSRFFLGEVS
jgi:hypothetical protein